MVVSPHPSHCNPRSENMGQKLSLEGTEPFASTFSGVGSAASERYHFDERIRAAQVRVTLRRLETRSDHSGAGEEDANDSGRQLAVASGAASQVLGKSETEWSKVFGWQEKIEVSHDNVPRIARHVPIEQCSRRCSFFLISCRHQGDGFGSTRWPLVWVYLAS